MFNYYAEDINFKFKKRRACSKWVYTTLQEEGILIHKVVRDVSFIFCSDEYLLALNKQYLSHDYYTDVITFDNSDEQVFSGDIFISVDRVKENAETYGQSFIDELHRVMIHGILHLSGYKDANDDESLIIRSKEDYYLAKREF